MGILYRTYTSVNVETNGQSSGSLGGQATEFGASHSVIDAFYPASTTDALLTIAITAANLQELVLTSDKDVTLEANSGSSPAFTISLKAGEPLIWKKSPGYFANPITANVTAFYVTCATATHLQGFVLQS